METSLIAKLDNLTDKRRAQGKRHKMSTIVLITILASISQIYSLRGIETFVNRHRIDLINMLNIGKNGLPSYYVFCKVLPQIDFDELTLIIREWLIEQKLLSKDEWISIDGKSIRSTLSDSNTGNQNFVSVVTAFAIKSGISILSAKFENKLQSEIEIAENLIKALNLEGKKITMDALHSKKNS